MGSAECRRVSTGGRQGRPSGRLASGSPAGRRLERENPLRRQYLHESRPAEPISAGLDSACPTPDYSGDTFIYVARTGTQKPRLILSRAAVRPARDKINLGFWLSAKTPVFGLFHTPNRAWLLACMHAHACTCMHNQCMHAHECTCMHIHVHACTCMDMHAHTWPCLHMHADTCTCMHIHAHACTCMHMHAHEFTCMHVHALHTWMAG